MVSCWTVVVACRVAVVVCFSCASVCVVCVYVCDSCVCAAITLHREVSNNTNSTLDGCYL